MNWYERYPNIVALAEWLDSEVCFFPKPADVIAFFEKPPLFDAEWELYQMWSTEKDPLRRERIIEAAMEETGPDELRAEWERETDGLEED